MGFEIGSKYKTHVCFIVPYYILHVFIIYLKVVFSLL